MAARENQGLQIALILFVMITIGLAVTTFVFYKKAQEGIKEADVAAADLKRVTKSRDDVIDENNLLKKWIGHPEDEEIAKVNADFKKDMLAYAATIPEAERNYRSLPTHLLTVLRDKNAEVIAARQEADELRGKVDAAEAETKSVRVTLAGQFAEAKKVFEERGKVYVADVGRITGEQRKLRGQFDSFRETAAATEQAKEKEIDEMADELTKADTTLKALTEKVNERKTETFESPDGRVTWVNQRDKLVWINLGRQDNLRSQVNFSVHAKGVSNITSSARKGSIEVTRILDGHLAEARIVEDEDSDPILPGDVIYSPTWTAGRQLRFALAGLMDINGDENSDRSEVRNLILANNGLIDADVDENGNRTGRLSINTRYLVLGTRPTEKAGNEAIQAYSNMQKEAYDLGIEKISLEKLLDMMGYQGTVRSVTLGRHARSEDFKAKPEGGVSRKSTGNTSEIFQPRAPRRSAY
jgi:hypothetical protein